MDKIIISIAGAISVAITSKIMYMVFLSGKTISQSSFIGRFFYHLLAAVNNFTSGWLGQTRKYKAAAYPSMIISMAVVTLWIYWMVPVMSGAESTLDRLKYLGLLMFAGITLSVILALTFILGLYLIGAYLNNAGGQIKEKREKEKESEPQAKEEDKTSKPAEKKEVAPSGLETEANDRKEIKADRQSRIDEAKTDVSDTPPQPEPAETVNRSKDNAGEAETRQEPPAKSPEKTNKTNTGKTPTNATKKKLDPPAASIETIAPNQPDNGTNKEKKPKKDGDAKVKTKNE